MSKQSSMDLRRVFSLLKHFKTFYGHSKLSGHFIFCFNINNAMSSFAEFEVCANGDKSLWKKRQRKSLFTCKTVLKNINSITFIIIKIIIWNFQHLCIFLPKKILAKLQSNKTNVKMSIKSFVGGPFFDAPCII